MCETLDSYYFLWKFCKQFDSLLLLEMHLLRSKFTFVLILPHSLPPTARPLIKNVVIFVLELVSSSTINNQSFKHEYLLSNTQFPGCSQNFKGKSNRKSQKSKNLNRKSKNHKINSTLRTEVNAWMCSSSNLGLVLCVFYRTVLIPALTLTSPPKTLLYIYLIFRPLTLTKPQIVDP